MSRLKRPTFTENQYRQYSRSFWPMPREWGRGSPSFLSQLWEVGRGSVIGALPVLGQFTHTQQRTGLYLSTLEQARLSNQAPNTLDKGLALAEHRFALVAKQERQPGERANRWHVGPHIAASKGPDGRLADYFHFPARWIYGGQWALLSPPERLLLLALAAHADVRTEEPVTSHYLAHLGWDWEADRSDLQASWGCNDLGFGEQRGHAYRVVAAGSGELQNRTSLSRSTISSIIRTWTQVRPQWPWGECVDREGLPLFPERQLVRAYPLQTGRYLFHFRDHVEPWPFDELNQRLGLTADTQRSGPGVAGVASGSGREVNP
jgi:hypothetical protein